jgi:hypothetical protein
LFIFELFFTKKTQRMKTLKKKLLILCAFIMIAAAAFATVRKLYPQNDCTTQTVFWGTTCCKYEVILNTIPGPVTVVFDKCCDYRFFFPSNCESSGGTILQ